MRTAAAYVLFLAHLIQVWPRPSFTPLSSTRLALIYNTTCSVTLYDVYRYTLRRYVSLRIYVFFSFFFFLFIRYTQLRNNDKRR